jgi:pimeloyl-ACP methyl ester carboxylesterase
MHPLSGRTIVFLPGMDGTGISFEPLREVLPKDVAVTIIRYPADRLLSFEETVRCAGDQVRAVPEGAIVLAESFSGPVAVALAASGHVKAKCLILCSTFARSPRPRFWRMLSHLPLGALMKLPFPLFLFKHTVEGGAEAAHLFLAMWERVKVLVPAKVLAHRLLVMSQVDVRPWLPNLPIPCCYIQAASDRSVPSSALFDFIELVPDLRVKRIRGPHFILQAQPQASLSAIQDFVGSLAEHSSGTVPPSVG